jgi:hypothetical protein
MGESELPISREHIPPEIIQSVHRLVEANRLQCLWFMKEDYLPREALEIDSVLAQIELHGDRRAWIQARNLRAWLLQNINARS